MKNYPVISERSYAEWASWHPLRERLPVLPDEVLARADVVVCTIEGEPRHPAGPDDYDVVAACHACGVPVVHRASAPDLPKECWRCFVGKDMRETPVKPPEAT